MSKPEQKQATAKAEPKAPKSYLIPKPYYREGAYYEAGSLVSIPADEKPGAGWVDAAEARAASPAPVAAPATAQGKPGESPL